MTIIDALKNRNLLGGLPAFRDLSTWRAWLVFFCAVYGLAFTELRTLGVTEDQALELFRQHTGRMNPRQGGYPESVLIVGVQSGKSQAAGAMGDFAAITGPPGTHALLLGQDHRSAMRTLFRYAVEPFETLGAFKAEVVRSTADTLELRNGASLSAYPCRPQSIRGLRACFVAIDELAFFTNAEGRAVDTEMLRAARGRVATTNGKLVVLSSPYAQSGALYDLHRKHYGREDSPTLIWQAESYAMNPLLSADYLRRMEEDDPLAYSSEVLGQFRAGISALFDPDALQDCVASAIRERAPDPRVQYTAHYDASGGRSDAAALCIAHLDRHVAVLDALRVWPAPHDPSVAIAEAAATLRSYGIRRVAGDRYAGSFVSEQFTQHHIQYKSSEQDRSALYLELLPLVNSGRVRLLDNTELLRELRGLERRQGASGRDRVDHRSGQHDDRAVAAAGALVATTSRAYRHSPLTMKCLRAGQGYIDPDQVSARRIDSSFNDEDGSGLPASF